MDDESKDERQLIKEVGHAMYKGDINRFREIVEDPEFCINAQVAENAPILIYAVILGNLEMVKEILAHPKFSACQSMMGPKEMTAYHFVKNNNLECIKALYPLCKEYLDFCGGKHHLKPLQLAIREGTAAVDALLGLGADPTALLDCANSEIMEELLRPDNENSLALFRYFMYQRLHQCHVVHSDSESKVYSLLYYAIKVGHCKAVCELLKRGAKVNYKVRPTFDNANLSNVAIRNVQVRNPQYGAKPEDTVEIAWRVIEASAEPPSFFVILEFYTTHLARKLSCLSAEERLPKHLVEGLMRILAAAFANTHSSQNDELISYNRSPCNFVLVNCQNSPLQQLAANSLRRQLLENGQNNIAEALHCERIDPGLHSMIAMDKVREKYLERIRAHFYRD